MKVGSASIHRTLSEFYEDTGVEQTDLNDSVLLKWGEQKAQEVITDEQLSHNISWLTVENYKATKPKNVKIILEVAYKKEKPKDSCKAKGIQITQYVQDTHEGCTVEYNVKCNKCKEVSCNCVKEDVIFEIDSRVAARRPEIYYDNYLRAGRFGEGYSIYTPSFKILPHAKAKGLHNIKNHIPNCPMFTLKGEDWYVMDGDHFEVSFEQGELLVSYMGTKLDENGDLMVPDHPYAYDAITEFMIYKYYRKQYLEKRDPSDRAIYSEAFQLSNLATQRARNTLNIPDFNSFLSYWANNAWVKMDSAYDALLNGKRGISNIKNRKIYRS